MATQIQTGSQSVLNGRDYARIKQRAFPGTIIELDVSTLALAIGPDSEVPSLTVAYFDEVANQSTELLHVSVGNPFVGRLDAIVDAMFPGSDLPGRIVAYPTDNMPDFTRFFYTGFGNVPAPADISYVQEAPLLDLLAYTTATIATVPQERAPLNFVSRVTLPDTTTGGALNTNYNIPIYGRRQADIIVTSQDLPVDISVEISGFPVFDGLTSLLFQGFARTVFVVPTVLAATGLATFPLDFDTLGSFDILNVSFLDAANPPDVSANYTTGPNRQLIFRVLAKD